MLLQRKIIKVGHSRAVVIPASWLNYHEKIDGGPITTVSMEVNGKITIKVEHNHDEKS